MVEQQISIQDRIQRREKTDEIVVNNLSKLVNMVTYGSNLPGLTELYYQALTRNLGPHLANPKLISELRHGDLLDVLTQKMTTFGAEVILASTLTDRETTRELEIRLMDELFPDNFSEGK